MSVGIRINHAFKKYGDNVIIPDLNLEVKQGEFFTLLGPSGCGKTTLLRMIAGFSTIEGGDFRFNDQRVNNLDPAKRNIGMVFQNYAIFPHLTVRKNVEFGLTNKKFPKREIAKRADKFMKLVQIELLADRLPERLSGGQQQRVALARALCIKPDVLLMDEPLSNLDAKLRVELRAVIKDIQHNIGITTIYVTHDQNEAMAISDRIAVINAGVIQHIGTPKKIYQRPANLFVATFIGSSNILNGRLLIIDGATWLQLPNSHKVRINNVAAEYRREQDVIVSVRPEELLFCHDADKDSIKATIDDCTFFGMDTHYLVHLETGEKIEAITESSIDRIIDLGAKVSLSINAEKVNLFTADGSANILTGVCNDCTNA